MAELKIPKPLPSPTEDSKSYWDGCQQKKLMLQKCDDCGLYRFPPSILCPRCMSMNFQRVKASGRARILSWEVTHQVLYPAFDTPFNVAIVELEEGPRMHVNIVGCKNEKLYADMPVKLFFEKVEDQDWYLPKFKPASG